jgi:membrane protein
MDSGKRMGKPKSPGFRSFAQQLWMLLKETYAEWSKDNASQLGAALAFYTIFSLAPILIIIVAIVGLVLGKGSVQIYILGELTKLIGHDNAQFVMNTIQRGYQAGSGIKATLIAIFLVLVGSTTVCTMLKNALNTMWGVKSDSSGLFSFIKERIKSLLIILFAGIFLFLSMILSSLISNTSLFLSDYIEISLTVIILLNNIVAIFLLTLLFAMLFKVLPDVKISWGDVWIGGAITSLLFTLGKFLLSLYLARSTVSSVYGAAGSLVVLLLWVYYSAQIIFLGAEFTQVYARTYGAEIVPKTPSKPPFP